MGKFFLNGAGMRFLYKNRQQVFPRTKEEELGGSWELLHPDSRKAFFEGRDLHNERSHGGALGGRP